MSATNERSRAANIFTFWFRNSINEVQKADGACNASRNRIPTMCSDNRRLQHRRSEETSLSQRLHSVRSSAGGMRRHHGANLFKNIASWSSPKFGKKKESPASFPRSPSDHLCNSSSETGYPCKASLWALLITVSSSKENTKEFECKVATENLPSPKPGP